MIGDLPVYVVGTPGAKVVVVLGEPNNWGGRSKGIADTLAAEGYFVVMPDCFRKDNADAYRKRANTEDVMPWIKGYSWEKVVGPDFSNLLNWIVYEKECPGVNSGLKVGAIGFCWGVWAFIKASGAGLPISCGVGPHPSHRLEGAAFGNDEAAMMSKLQMPVLLMPAGNDRDVDKPGGENMKFIEAKGGRSDVFPEMQHGWMIRGDLNDAAVKRDAEDCMKRALAFFKQHL